MEGNHPVADAPRPPSQASLGSSPEASSGPEVRTYLFGPWKFRSSPRVLERQGQPVDLRPQALQVLDELLSNVGEVVCREQLKEAVFADRPFLDHRQAINLAVLRLRRALGDHARNPRYIETVGRQGYRFIHPVEISTSALVHSSISAKAAPETAANRDGHARGGDRGEFRWLGADGPLVRIGSAVVAVGIILWSLSAFGVEARLGSADRGPDPSSVLEVSPWLSAEAGSEDRSRALTAELVARLHGAASPGWRVRQPGEGSPRHGILEIEGSSRPSGARLVVTLRLSRPDDRVQIWSKVETIDPLELDAWLDRAARELLAEVGRSGAATGNRERAGSVRRGPERGSSVRDPSVRGFSIQSIDPAPSP
ncbi:MAG: winged helix-turn-helix domain-containing protein [Holophagales bacterium]|nr:winged helix-turn-helix domain-containing protein [Holophagales bacterium]